MSLRRTGRKASKKRRHLRIRKKVAGTPERPRLSVFRSLNHLNVQLVDDVSQKTICSVSTMDKEFKKISKASGNVEAASKLGSHFGKKAKDQGIDKVTFDRGGYLYHGRIKALADGLRQAGIQF